MHDDDSLRLLSSLALLRWFWLLKFDILGVDNLCRGVRCPHILVYRLSAIPKK